MKFRDTLLISADIGENRSVLRDIFDESYHLLEADNRGQAMLLLQQNRSCVAGVLLDIERSGEKAAAFVEEMRRRSMLAEIPVVVVIHPDAGVGEEELFEIGVSDVIVKPCNPRVIRRRVQTIAELYRHKWHLEELVEEQAKTLRHSNQMMVGALSSIIEHRSLESGQHILRIRSFTRILLEDIAVNWPEYELTKEKIDIISSAAALHDIGKISVPDAILNKPSYLTSEEFEIMKAHSVNGSQMLESLNGVADEEYLRYAYNICRHHHERWDGKGYPDGLKGDAIPICAQAVGLADVYDALTTPRVYKAAYPNDRAVNMILNGECGAFSPKLLESFKNVRRRFAEQAQAYADGQSPEMEAMDTQLPDPMQVKRSLHTVQLAQAKYQALLHYLDAMVLEVDLGQGIFHMVYNPNPDFNLKYYGDTFEGFVQEMLRRRVHLEDREAIRDLFAFCTEELFDQGLWKHSCRCRLFSSDLGTYRPYEVTVMRVDMGDPEQRGVLVVTRAVKEERSAASQEQRQSDSGLSGLVNSTLRCRSDGGLTIVDGASRLQDLVGYTAEEVREVFHDRLMEMILPEDRDTVSGQFSQQLSRGNIAELEYRIRHKDGRIVWLLGRYRRVTGRDELEYLYCILIDNTQARAAQDELKLLLERHEMILSQSNDIIFEWDLVKDALTISDKWQDLFGYAPIDHGISAAIDEGTHFHPDDIPALRGMMEQLHAGKRYLEAEARVATSRGRYLWCRFRASGQYDETGRLIKVVGVIINIDAAKRANLALQERADRDALTKLLNKESAQKQVKDCLNGRPEGYPAALLVLDLDNFKQVNDRYGHLFGDATLTRTADEIRRIFRKEDIIGRIGGDEFMVFLHDIPSAILVEERCRQLVASFRTIFSESLPECQVTCSVGAALVPEHGNDFLELFRHADEALYQAKRQGKNRYVIYDPKRADEVMLDELTTGVGTRIDSDDHLGLAHQGLIQYVFQKLYEADDLDAGINDVLALVGRQIRVSRVYIFENNDDDTACDNTFEWCNEGISPEIENLQNLNYTTDIPGWQENYDEHGVFYIPDITQLPRKQRDVLEPQGIRSMLQCAILDRGKFRGFVGFDECATNRLWTQEQVELLSFLSRVLSMFLMKDRAQKYSEARAEELTSILDNQDAWIYVIDEAYRIKFLNAKTREVVPSIRTQMRCYETLMRRAGPCEGCPAANIHRNLTGSSMIKNPYLNVTVRADATLIRWEGEEACLINCHQLEQHES